jgi:hypothetical protein
MNKELNPLLKSYSRDVQALVLETRKFITGLEPGILEMIDNSARVIGYGFGAGYADLICTIILSKGGIKLGISRSAKLPDPCGLLQGAGKLHRYVVLNDPSELKNPGLEELIKTAIVAWKRKSEI